MDSTRIGSLCKLVPVGPGDEPQPSDKVPGYSLLSQGKMHCLDQITIK